MGEQDGSPPVESADLDPLMTRFVEVLIAQIPGCLGPYRGQVEPLWLQTSELYGSVASLRGLAAGDVIEEFQGLRESLIRHLYQQAPDGGQSSVGLREALRLNRIVDQGVTQASVGHTDALFFALIEGSGVPDAPTPGMLQEIEAQLETLAAEHAEVAAGAAGH